VSNILKKQAGAKIFKAIDPRLFEHEAEQKLAQQLEQQTEIVKRLYHEANYTQALSQLSSLKEPVDFFFDKVMVMVDDPAKRDNRLALLAALHHLFTQVADISLLQ
jgi:glycyl-tRNA synthetase beta chain